MRTRPTLLALPVATLALALGGCGERPQETHFQRASHHEADISVDVETGVGGRSTGERGSSDPLRYAYYGLPLRDALVPQDLVLYNDGYVVGYDVERKAPAWTCYRLFAGAQGSAKEQKAASGPDPRLPAGSDQYSQAMNDKHDHNQSAFVSLAPASGLASCYGEAAGTQALLSSDMVRTGEATAFNQLTGMEPSYAQAYNELWVISGPLFGDGGKVDGLWKIQVTVQDGKSRAQAFALPVGGDRNAKGVDLAQHLTTVAELEHRTGLRFFSDFHDTWDDTRELMETAHPDGLWPTGGAVAGR